MENRVLFPGVSEGLEQGTMAEQQRKELPLSGYYNHLKIAETDDRFPQGTFSKMFAAAQMTDIFHLLLLILMCSQKRIPFSKSLFYKALKLREKFCASSLTKCHMRKASTVI